MRREVNNTARLYFRELKRQGHVRPLIGAVLLALAVLGSLPVRVAHAQTGDVTASAVLLPPRLNVLTWNIRGGETRRNPKSGKFESVPCRRNSTGGYIDKVTNEIRRHPQLDVVALQEVYRSQAETLRQKLAGHLGTRPDLFFVETRSCDAGRANNDYGIAIISRYSLSRRETVSLCFALRPGEIAKPFCRGRETRMLARAVIDVEGRPIHVYNTHLSPDESEQEGQAGVIADQVSKDRDSAARGFAFRPVLMGDFNASPGSDAYRRIRQARLLDAWREVHCTAGDCDPNANALTFDTFSPHARIDYVFVGSGGVFRVEDAHVTRNETLFDIFALENPNARRHFNKVPDHLPVVAHLRISL